MKKASGYAAPYSLLSLLKSLWRALGTEPRKRSPNMQKRHERTQRRVNAKAPKTHPVFFRYRGDIKSHGLRVKFTEWCAKQRVKQAHTKGFR